ncbi:hypothetical protein [Kitasatospora sp. NPDC093102]|uniref:hypothetical protein n=1 Tax=Kitasatospora sp. NPDC093102 TaxID=3155069 RepID=UPI00342BA45C
MQPYVLAPRPPPSTGSRPVTRQCVTTAGTLRGSCTRTWTVWTAWAVANAAPQTAASSSTAHTQSPVYGPPPARRRSGSEAVTATASAAAHSHGSHPPTGSSSDHAHTAGAPAAAGTASPAAAGTARRRPHSSSAMALSFPPVRWPLPVPDAVRPRGRALVRSGDGTATS